MRALGNGIASLRGTPIDRAATINMYVAAATYASADKEF